MTLFSLASQANRSGCGPASGPRRAMAFKYAAPTRSFVFSAAIARALDRFSLAVPDRLAKTRAHMARAAPESLKRCAEQWEQRESVN
jgi:hypothetical protein